MLGLIWLGLIIKSKNMINHLPYCLDMCGNIFLILCIVFSIPFLYKLPQLLKIIVSTIVISMSIFVPIIMGTNLLWIMRGTLSDLSLNTTIILLILAINKVFGISFPKINYQYALLIFITGLISYLSVFGFIDFSLYDLGFIPNWLFFLVLYGASLLIWRFNRFYSWILLISLAGFYYKVQISINLWDYVIDPILWLYSIIILMMPIFKRNKYE